jgi:hypothetical protein
MFDRVSVWLDELAPEGGAFAHALEWATRLGLPLHGVVLSSARGQTAGPGQPPAPEVRTLQSCAESCRRQHVSWEGAVWQAAPALGVRDFLSAGSLCVYGQSLPAARREELLYWSSRSPAAAALVCTDAWSPLGRILLLNQGQEPRNTFLAVAGRICRAFRAVPVVLTVARSEAAARSRQRLAQESFAAQQLTGDFDFVVGCDVRAAVALEAHCRRCTHVILERQVAPTWWRWLRGDPIHRLLGLANPLTLLAVSRDASPGFDGLGKSEQAESADGAGARDPDGTTLFSSTDGLPRATGGSNRVQSPCPRATNDACSRRQLNS